MDRGQCSGVSAGDGGAVSDYAVTLVLWYSAAADASYGLCEFRLRKLRCEGKTWRKEGMSICSRRVCSPRWWAARQVLARTLSHSKSGLASSCEARNCNARPRRSPSTAANPFLADLCVLVGRLARGLVEERPNQQRRASVPATAACARGTEFVLWNLYRRRRWA